MYILIVLLLNKCLDYCECVTDIFDLEALLFLLHNKFVLYIIICKAP